MKKDESLDIYFYVMGWLATVFLVAMITIVLVKGTGFLYKFPKCAFLSATGLYCPGCGGTRATFAFFRGHFIRSFILHPIVPYAALVCGWFMISQTIERISRHRIKIAMHFRNIYVWLGIFIILGNWIVKNILVFAGIRLLG